MKAKCICLGFLFTLLVSAQSLFAQPLQNNVNTMNLTLKNNTSQWLLAASHNSTRMHIVPVINGITAWGNGVNFYQNGTMFVSLSVGIGTPNTSGYRLAVNGNIRAKEIRVNTGWSDFVFEEDYSLPTLSEVESHIKAHKHLPDIPSAAEVEAEGVELGVISSKLLQKVEELTLYVIDQEKRIAALEAENKALQQVGQE